MRPDSLLKFSSSNGLTSLSKDEWEVPPHLSPTLLPLRRVGRIGGKPREILKLSSRSTEAK